MRDSESMVLRRAAASSSAASASLISSPVVMTRSQTTEGTAVDGDIRLSLTVRADAASEQAGGPVAAG